MALKCEWNLDAIALPDVVLELAIVDVKHYLIGLILLIAILTWYCLFSVQDLQPHPVLIALDLIGLIFEIPFFFHPFSNINDLIKVINDTHKLIFQVTVITTI